MQSKKEVRREDKIMIRQEEKGLSGRIRKEAVFVMVTVFLILSLWLFVSETVMSQTEGNITVDETAFFCL